MKEIELIQKEDIKDLFIERNKESNKGTFGYVAIMGGCKNYAGAIKLAMLSCAALRGGAGVVRVIVPESIAYMLGPYLLEQTLFPIKDLDSHMLFIPEEIEKSLKKIKALAIGMGWGESEEQSKILTYILENREIPIVIDADGINTLAKMNLELLKKAKGTVILTPHLKEFERISKNSIEEIKEKPVELVKEFARTYKVILLLKGSTTIVTDGENVHFVKRGCPGMATAGSGDVLSGIIVGMLGSHEPNIKTVSAAAYLAGLAGEIAQDQKTDIAMIASDTVANIPKAIKLIREERGI